MVLLFLVQDMLLHLDPLLDHPIDQCSSMFLLRKQCEEFSVTLHQLCKISPSSYFLLNSVCILWHTAECFSAYIF